MAYDEDSEDELEAMDFLGGVYNINSKEAER